MIVLITNKGKNKSNKNNQMSLLREGVKNGLFVVIFMGDFFCVRDMIICVLRRILPKKKGNLYPTTRTTIAICGTPALVKALPQKHCHQNSKHPTSYS